MNKKFLLRAIAILTTVLIVGCSSPIHKRGQEWTGKFSVSTVYKKKAQRDSGTFLLSKTADNSELILKGPLGTAGAVIEETPRGAVLKVPNEQPVYANTSATLSMRLIGAPISLNQLIEWMESNGNLDMNPADDLRDNGWDVDIEKSDNSIKRITAERKETRSQPAVKLILIPSQAR